MTPPTDFLSCDWGTSSFRLRLVVGAERRIVHEVRSSVGIKSLLEQARAEGRATMEQRAPLLAGYLRQQVEELLAAASTSASSYPLILSGMASSSVGWQELPYAAAPFPLDGSGARVAELDWDAPAGVAFTRLVSGVATAVDMMRGEETEILGLMAAPEMQRYRERCLLLLPGTHSKHVQVVGDEVIGWRTFMTGELFEVLGRHSLLQASVDLAATRTESWAPCARAAFRAGVEQARAEGLAGSLFHVRSRAVLAGASPAENAWFLSGLLLGAEVAEGLSRVEPWPVVLAATGRLSALYAEALSGWPGVSELLVVPPGRMERAVVDGHALLLRHG